MTPAQMEELALRIESLTGPDREVDIAIALSQTDRFFNAGPRYEGAADRIGKIIDGLPHVPGQAHDMLVPRYTASLDAAMGLVPDGHTIQLSDWEADLLRKRGAWQAIVLPIGSRGSMTDFTFTNRCDHAATPALALAAASLRARSRALAGAGEGREAPTPNAAYFYYGGE
jgi:hypothetical protein